MIEFRILGLTSLHGPEGNQLHSVLSRPKILSLLAALGASERPEFIRRETLLGLLWAETDPERARASLRQATYQLRRSIGPKAIEGRGEDELRLSPGHVWTDVWAFEEAVKTGDLESALDLYRGPLLEGLFPNQAPEFERWVDQRRSELRKKVSHTAWTLAKQMAEEQNWSGAAHWARRAATLCETEEILIRRSMGLLASIGDLGGAAEVYHGLKKRLEDEFDLSPAAETDAVFKEILTRREAEPEKTASESDPRPSIPKPTALQPRWALMRWGIGPLMAVLVVLGGLWVGERAGSRLNEAPARETGEDSSAPALPRNVLAVLPFQGHGGDPRTEQFAAGVHQDILTQLSRISDLTVISRRSVEAYRESDLSVQAISRELRAGSILEGTVRWEGDRVRVSAELVDASSQTQIWAGSYDRHLSDLFQAQSGIAEQVALALEATLTTEDLQGPSRLAAVDAAAYGLFLRARGAGGLWTNLEGLLEEEELLRLALAQDPEFAAAWAALGRNFARRPREFGLPEFWADSALAAAERAIALDPNLAEAYLARGWVFHERGYLARALESFSEALRLEPNLVEARHRRGFVLAALGQFDLALADLHHALQREPTRAQYRARVARTYALLGDTASAEKWARKEIELPNLPPSWRFQVEAEMHLWGGHTTAAFRTGIQMVRSAPDEPGLRSFLADLALQAGECRTAVTEARSALNLSSNPEILAYYFMAKTILGFSLKLCGEPSHAIPHLEETRDRLLTRFAAGMQQPLEALELGALFFALGDQESARNWIQEAYEAGSRHVGFLRTHPIFLGLRSDPQVVEIMSRMQEDVDRMRARVAEAPDTTVSG